MTVKVRGLRAKTSHFLPCRIKTPPSSSPKMTGLSKILINSRIKGSLHHLRDGSIVIQQPKTAKARRHIALPPSAALILKEHKQNKSLECAMFGTSLKDDSLVFSQVDGEPLLPDTVSHAWVKMVKRAGLKHFRLHDGRHTHASLLLKQNVHPKVVQERLGHATISTTVDLYSHVAPGLQEAAAKHFDEAFNHRYNETADHENRTG